MFFEKDESTQPDPLFDQNESNYKYITKTNKVLKMNRVLLKENNAEVPEMNTEDLDKEHTELNLTRTYEEALNLFCIGKTAPRKISSKEDIDLQRLLMNSSIEDE